MLKYSVIFLGLSVTLFLIVLLIRKKDKKLSDILLLLWFLTSFFHLLFYYLGFNEFLLGQHFLIAIGNSLPVVHILINALYIDVLRFKSIRNLAFSYGFIILIYIVLFYYMSYSGSILQSGVLLNYSSNAAEWTYLIPPSFLMVYIIIGSYILKSINHYRINLKSSYSNNLDANINWLVYWFWSYIAGSILVISTVLLMDFKVFNPNVAYVIVAAVMSLQVFIVGQLGVVNNFNFSRVSNTHLKYRSSGLRDGKKEELKEKLLDYLAVSKAYLNPELSLKDLAREIGLPEYQVSQLINETLNTNFYDLINKYRINTFKTRIQNSKYDHMSILGLALDCGFNSKSGFYKVFKKQIGMTPSEYKKKSNK